MPNIYNHIDNNKRQTWLIMAGFISVVSILGWFIGEFWGDGLGLPFVGYALIFSGVTSFISYYNSAQIVLAISGAKEVTPEENKYLHNLVENLCIGAGMTKPKRK